MLREDHTPRVRQRADDAWATSRAPSRRRALGAGRAQVAAVTKPSTMAHHEDAGRGPSRNPDWALCFVSDEKCSNALGATGGLPPIVRPSPPSSSRD